MIKPLYCIVDQNSGKTREKNRQIAIAKLKLDQNEIIPIFEEATQTAANLLKVPVSSLGILIENEYRIKSAYGLSNLGLGSQLVKTRKISRDDSFAVNVIDSGSCLAIENSIQDPFFADSILAQHYYVISYLGVPLTVSSGHCIGCLEIMDIKPRSFSATEIETLNLIARWCLAEYENNHQSLENLVASTSPFLNYSQENIFPSFSPPPVQKNGNLELVGNPEKINNNQPHNTNESFSPNSYLQKLSIQLINKLIQKLSIPLTSIIGMSSVLKQGTYGKLNQKQTDYLNIVYNCGQEMTTLVTEINNLSNFNPNVEEQVSAVDIENLGKQVIDSLSQAAENRQHTLRFSLEPGKKLWRLNQEKLKQTLYYLLFSIIEGSRSGGEISIHISQLSSYDKSNEFDLNINCWVRHPWLGDGISFEKINIYHQVIDEATHNHKSGIRQQENELKNNYDYDVICLLFASYLVQIQGGKIDLKGSSASGYRFLLSIPIVDLA